MGSARGRPAWWRELLLIGATYGAYTLTRNTLPAHEAAARANALALLHAERHAHLDIERGLNDALAAPAGHALAVAADYTYSLAHFLVTLGVVGWLYTRHPALYRPARTVLLLTTVVGLVGFWLYPLAPPRFFPHLGFVDTVVRDGTWGSWGSNAVTSISNQFAAMPSIHVAWAVWSAAVVIRLARSRWLVAAAVAYPVAVFLVIVGTANHWTLDAAGGLAALAVGFALYRAGQRLRPRRRGSPAAAAPAARSSERHDALRF